MRWLDGIISSMDMSLSKLQELVKKRGVCWAARRSNQSILKEIGPEYSMEGLILKLKHQYFSYLMQN